MNLAWFLPWLAACSGHLSMAPVRPSAQPHAAPVVATPDEQRPAELMLAHWPWLGTRSFVEVYTAGTARVLRVSRVIDSGIAARWKLRFEGASAHVVDEITNELANSASVETSCPKRHGKDGVFWAVRVPATNTRFGLAFRLQGGGPECARFEATAVRLMKLAKLHCGWTLCLRPEEIANRRLSCASGEDGRECQEAPEDRFVLSEELLQTLRE